MSAHSLMCSRGFLAPVVLMLLRTVQVAPKVLSPPPRAREVTPAFRYPIAVDGLATNVHADYTPSQSVVAEGGNFAYRVLRYEMKEAAGLGDRLAVIARLLSIATQWNVRLAFPPPQDALVKHHGISSALRWGEYMVTEPRIIDSSQLDCAPGAPTFNITSKEDFESFVQSEHSALVHADQHVCVRLQEHYFTLKESEVFKGLTEKGAPAISLWTSSKVANLAAGVKRELAAHYKAAQYNAIHVRLEDKATPKCSSTARVTEAVSDLTQRYPDYAQEPWFLMSDGDVAFFGGMHAAMYHSNFTLITERDLVTTRHIDDNYLVFSALECVFATSDLALISFKDVGTRCMPGAQHAVQPKFLGCLDHDNA